MVVRRSDARQLPESALHRIKGKYTRPRRGFGDMNTVARAVARRATHAGMIVGSAGVSGDAGN
jgi:hypothetical protein